MDICGSQKEQHSSNFQSWQNLLEQKTHGCLLCQESPESRHFRMVQHTGNAGEIRHALIRYLHFCFQEYHSEKKGCTMVYYSKKHVDIAKGVAAPEEPRYYTVAEAIEMFNLTRD